MGEWADEYIYNAQKMEALKERERNMKNNLTIQNVITERSNELMNSGLSNQEIKSFQKDAMSIISANPKLAEANQLTLFNAIVKAKQLKLPIGTDRVYFIPQMNNGELQVRMDIGYKGYTELAIKSGMYKTLNVSDVREGEIAGRNRLTGEIDWNWIQDDNERSQKEIIGYVAFFELKDGYKKTLYMTMQELEEHLTKYSSAYQSYKKNGNSRNIWASNTDAMYKKTVMKLLITRHGAITNELEIAKTFDTSVIENDKPNYIDNPNNIQYEKQPTKEELIAKIKELSPEFETNNPNVDLTKLKNKDLQQIVYTLERPVEIKE